MSTEIESKLDQIIANQSVLLDGMKKINDGLNQLGQLVASGQRQQIQLTANKLASLGAMLTQIAQQDSTLVQPAEPNFLYRYVPSEETQNKDTYTIIVQAPGAPMAYLVTIDVNGERQVLEKLIPAWEREFNEYAIRNDLKEGDTFQVNIYHTQMEPQNDG